MPNAFSLLALILFQTSFAFAQEATGFDCSNCYSMNEEACTQTCSKKSRNVNSGKFQKCKRLCILNACNKNCHYGQQSKGSDSFPEAVNCDYCSRKSLPNCNRECEGKDSSCVKICVSQTCRNYCTLPDRPEDLFRESQVTTCKQCQIREEDSCRNRCGNKAGSLACKVACVEQKCEANCRID